jgi:hypothetical protein
MKTVELRLDVKSDGHFYIMEGSVQLGEMEVSISGSNRTVYHPQVSDKGCTE